MKRKELFKKKFVRNRIEWLCPPMTTEELKELAPDILGEIVIVNR